MGISWSFVLFPYVYSITIKYIGFLIWDISWLLVYDYTCNISFKKSWSVDRIIDYLKREIQNVIKVVLCACRQHSQIMLFFSAARLALHTGTPPLIWTIAINRWFSVLQCTNKKLVLLYINMCVEWFELRECWRVTCLVIFLCVCNL